MSTLKAIGDKVIVTDLDNGEKKTKAGVIILDDSTVAAGERGIRPRWARVIAVGPEQKDVSEGDWVLLEHGRWTVGQNLDLGDGEFKFWMADPNGILGVSDVKPAELGD